MNAVDPSPDIPYPDSISLNKGSNTLTLIIDPPLSSVRRSHVPSPPSANGTETMLRSELISNSPSVMALQTCLAVREPLNLSGAMRITVRERRGGTSCDRIWDYVGEY